MRYICIAVFGFIAGFIADKFGRKQPIAFALTILGASFAILGINVNEASILVYLVSSGIAWGLLFVTFLAVPGDLSTAKSREKFYALGYVLPLAIMFALSSVPRQTMTTLIVASSLAQILSIVLFISIVPIWRAKETLPKEKIDERNIQEHLEKVEETIEKTHVESK